MQASLPVAHRIFVSRPGIEPAPPALAARFFTTGPPGTSPRHIIFRALWPNSTSHSLLHLLVFVTTQHSLGNGLHFPFTYLLLLLFSGQVVSDALQPLNCSTLGFPVLHYAPEFAQTHVHWCGTTEVSLQCRLSLGEGGEQHPSKERVGEFSSEECLVLRGSDMPTTLQAV